MKKVLCLMLSLAVIFCFSGCSKKEKKPQNGIDLEYYANLGKIPECSYSLGADVTTVKDDLSAETKNDEGAEGFYDFKEDGGIGCIQNGTYKFYYKTDNGSEGLSCIASFDTAYGFGIGEVILTVKEAISGIQYTEEKINDDNAFFLFVPIDGSVLKCEFEKNTIVFVFENNALCATAIYNNDF